MEDEDGIWLVLLTAGMACLVVGLLLLEDAAWYVRYAALGGRFCCRYSQSIEERRVRLRSEDANGVGIETVFRGTWAESANRAKLAIA
jgi:hypothetical protein